MRMRCAHARQLLRQVENVRASYAACVRNAAATGDAHGRLAATALEKQAQLARVRGAFAEVELEVLALDAHEEELRALAAEALHDAKRVRRGAQKQTALRWTSGFSFSVTLPRRLRCLLPTFTLLLFCAFPLLRPRACLPAGSLVGRLQAASELDATRAACAEAHAESARAEQELLRLERELAQANAGIAAREDRLAAARGRLEEQQRIYDEAKSSRQNVARDVAEARAARAQLEEELARLQLETQRVDKAIAALDAEREAQLQQTEREKERVAVLARRVAGFEQDETRSKSAHVRRVLVLIAQLKEVTDMVR